MRAPLSAIGAVVAAVSCAISPTSAALTLSMDDRPTLEECDRRARDEPDELESYLCYWIVSRSGLRDEARKRLAEALAVDRSNHGARLYLGMVEADRYGPDAERLLSEASQGFASEGNEEGEFYARLGLQGWLAFRGRTREADVEIVRLRELAARSGDGERLAAAALAAAQARLDAGAFADGEVLLDAAAPFLFPDGPTWLRLRYLQNRARTAWSSGRLRQGAEDLGRAAELAESRGNRYFAALMRAQEAEALAALAERGQESAEVAGERTAVAIEGAVEAGNPAAEAIARWLRAGDPGVPAGERDRQAEAALALAARVGDVVDSSLAEVAMADRLLARSTPRAEAEAFERYDRAAELARRGGRRGALASARLGRAMVGIGRRPGDEVVRDHVEAIEVIERLRDLQWDHVVRARMLWNWSQAYYSLAEFLVDRDAPGDVERAFDVVERMRLRIATEIFDPAHDPLPANAGPELRAWRASLEEVGDLRRGLQSPGAPPAERAALVESLDRAERSEAAARRALAAVDPEFEELVGAKAAAVADVRGALAADEALVVYQTPPRGSLRPLPAWAFAVTRDGVRVVTLPDAADLRDAVAVALGSWRRPDRVSEGPSRALFEAVVAPVHAALPAGIRRWVVIPDGALHELPFAALVDPATGRVFADSHAVSIVPSATVWLRLRRAPSLPQRRGSLLALADPEPSKDRGDRDELPPLIHARREAQGARRALGGGTVLAGPDAVSGALRGGAVARPDIVLLAAHALVDRNDPERSAIALADGPLTLREIRDLPLEGAVVILSGCASATGETTAGEGVLGLSRAFFAAGARTVVATLWPVRDDEAARAVTAIARELGRGSTIEEALRRSQRAAAAQGIPVADWAAWVALGDTSAAPAPPRDPPPARSRWWPWTLAAGTALASAAWVARPRRVARPA